MTPVCPKCASEFECGACGYPLRKVRRDAVVTTSEVTVASAELRGYLDSVARQSPYAATFEHGPRGGAMIAFGRVKLECFLPFDNGDELLPFVPMPLDGSVVHDDVRPSEKECNAGTCGCDRPTGWRLTRPILRGMLGVSDAFLNEHGRDLPGVLPTWSLNVDTVEFMRECYFNAEFRFPTRASSRAARRERRCRYAEAGRRGRRRRM